MTYTFSTTLVPGSLTVYKDGVFFATLPASLIIIKQAVHYCHLICGTINLRIKPGEIAETETVEDVEDALIEILPAPSGTIPLKYVLTAAEVKNLNSVAKELIPAPGAGKAIDVISVVGAMSEGDDQFESVGLYVYTDTIGSPDAAFLFQDQNLLQIGYNGKKVKFIPSDTGHNYVETIIENKSIKIAADGNSTTGTSTLTLYIEYRIINL
jgi:hypothetical protein